MKFEENTAKAVDQTATAQRFFMLLGIFLISVRSMWSSYYLPGTVLQVFHLSRLAMVNLPLGRPWCLLGIPPNLSRTSADLLCHDSVYEDSQERAAWRVLVLHELAAEAMMSPRTLCHLGSVPSDEH